MKTIIKKLKLLNVAHSIAENYDSVPNKKKAEEIEETYDVADSLEEIKNACSEYEGYSPYDLVQLIKIEIDSL